MDYESLVSEILSRVIARIMETEAASAKENKCSAAEAPGTISETEQMQCKEKMFDKRVITEKDMYKCRNEGYNCIRIASNTIMTDLAKEYAEKNGIKVIKA